MRFFALIPFAALAAAVAVTPTPTPAPTIELEARVDSACTACVPRARADGFAVGSIIDSAASNVGSAFSRLNCVSSLRLLPWPAADCEDSSLQVCYERHRLCLQFRQGRGEPQRRSAPHSQPGRRRRCPCSCGRRARGRVDDSLSGGDARG
jgi:hypothetical protein